MLWGNVEITQENTNVETGNVVPQPSVEGWDLAMEFPDFPALGSRENTHFDLSARHICRLLSF